MRVKGQVVFLDVLLQIVSTQHLCDLHQLVIVITTLEERFFFEDLIIIIIIIICICICICIDRYTIPANMAPVLQISSE